MKIEKKLNGETMEVALDGRLDSVTAPELEKALLGCLTNVSELVFDFADLEYISSAGLRVLLVAGKSLKYGANVRIRNANELVREVFEVTNFDAFATIE